MAWLRIRLTEEQQRIVNEERSSHPNPRIREKMLVLWLLHNGVTRQKAAEIARRRSGHRPAIRGRVSGGGLGWPAAVERQSPGERDGRLSRVDPRVLREATRPHHGRGLRTHLSTDRVATRSQPGAQVPQRHGPEIPAGPPDPCAAQKNLAEHVETQADFLDTELKPCLDAAQAGRGPCVLRRRGPFRVRHVLVLPLVVHADLRPCGVRASAVQRAGCVERGDARTDRRDQHHGRQHRDDVRTAAEDRRVGTYRADHPGAGQRPLSTKRRGAGVGDPVGDHAAVPAVILAQPEPDRTPMEVHQTSRPLRPLPSDLRRVSSRHQRGHRRTFDHPR